MDLGIGGRTVIVTGGSGGMGREIARAFVAEGADVVLTYHNARAEADLVAKEADGRALVVPYELGDANSASALVAAALEWAGRIDVLVNNAVVWGSAGAPESRFEAVPDDAWLSDLRANVEGALQLSRAVAPVMRERRWGRMVHISSTLAVDPVPGVEYYATIKGALHGFSRAAAFGLGKDGDILSNVVMPGLTRTDTNAEIADANGDHYAAKAALGRLLTAKEVASAVVYLASAANTGVTGQVITVSGGA